MFSLAGYRESSARVAALSWGAEDLSAALGASANKDDDGRWLAPYELARSLCLYTAAAAGVAAVDTVYTDFRNLDGLRQFVERARRDGFGGMLAIHPDQIAVINESFTPSEDEISRAKRIVEAFASQEDTGVLALDGEMIDMPHLRQAQRILQLADKVANS